MFWLLVIWVGMPVLAGWMCKQKGRPAWWGVLLGLCFHFVGVIATAVLLALLPPVPLVAAQQPGYGYQPGSYPPGSYIPPGYPPAPGYPQNTPGYPQNASGYPGYPPASPPASPPTNPPV